MESLLLVAVVGFCLLDCLVWVEVMVVFCKEKSQLRFLKRPNKVVETNNRRTDCASVGIDGYADCVGHGRNFVSCMLILLV